MSFYFFFFNDTATTEIYTLSLHDALPISMKIIAAQEHQSPAEGQQTIIAPANDADPDRKSTRLNSSHTVISYAVFCLKKKKKKKTTSSSMTSHKQRPWTLVVVVYHFTRRI